jgi:hypothetical protein
LGYFAAHKIQGVGSLTQGDRLSLWRLRAGGALPIESVARVEADLADVGVGEVRL